MRKFIAAGIFAAALCSVSALPAAASTISFPVSGVTSFSSPSFDYMFAFSLGTASTIDGITASASSVYKKTSNVSFSSVTVLDASDNSIFSTSSVSGPGFFLYPDVAAAAGSYILDLKGTVSGGTGSFDGNLTVSSVPLPSSVALFGTALMGLGAFAFMRRSKTAALTARL